MAEAKDETIHVFIGTKAQYIKTAPLIRLLDRRGINYRLIDSGQHASLSAGLRSQLEIRKPDFVFASGQGDVESIPQAVRWSLDLARFLFSGSQLRERVFGACGGICVVHGDTPTTLLAALMARRAGLRVAHLEAGLRSFDVLNPFPEELIRIVVMRLAHVLFAPDKTAMRNLERMGLVDRAVALSANTSAEAVRHAIAQERRTPQSGVLVTMHRVENLNRRARVRRLVNLVKQIAHDRPVRFVLHGPTRAVLERLGYASSLRRAGVELLSLQPYSEFVNLLAASAFVITDGGSIQEEAAALGVPTLLWRKETERPHGLGRNVVLSRYDPIVVRRFVEKPELYRAKPKPAQTRPSEEILEVLLRQICSD